MRREDTSGQAAADRRCATGVVGCTVGRARGHERQKGWSGAGGPAGSMEVGPEKSGTCSGANRERWRNSNWRYSGKLEPCICCHSGAGFRVPYVIPETCIDSLSLRRVRPRASCRRRRWSVAAVVSLLRELSEAPWSERLGRGPKTTLTDSILNEWRSSSLTTAGGAATGRGPRAARNRRPARGPRPVAAPQHGERGAAPFVDRVGRCGLWPSPSRSAPRRLEAAPRQADDRSDTASVLSARTRGRTRRSERLSNATRSHSGQRSGPESQRMHCSSFPRVVPLDSASVRGSPGTRPAFLGTDLHASSGPSGSAPALLPFVAPCSNHCASDNARCASPVRSSPCPDVSSRRTGARSKGHRPDCCFSANRAAAHGVHGPFFALLPRLREPRPSLPATMACPPWPTFTCWCCTTTCWRPPVFSFWSVRQPA